MDYYDLTKQERIQFRAKVAADLHEAIQTGMAPDTVSYLSSRDTYVRKVAFEVIANVYKTNAAAQKQVIRFIQNAFLTHDEHIRQTATNAMGEIGIYEPDAVGDFFDQASEDDSPKVRNAVIGSLKKIGQKHPSVVIDFAKRHCKNTNEEVRRIAMHGLELRGRTYPTEILPTLKLFQNESKSRLKKMLIHVIGQSSYKKGCLEGVIAELKTWDKQVLGMALKEIYAVHVYYADFAYYSAEEARQMILAEFQYVLDPTVLQEIEELYIAPGKKVAGRKK